MISFQMYEVVGNRSRRALTIAALDLDISLVSGIRTVSALHMLSPDLATLRCPLCSVKCPNNLMENRAKFIEKMAYFTCHLDLSPYGTSMSTNGMNCCPPCRSPSPMSP